MKNIILTLCLFFTPVNANALSVNNEDIGILQKVKNYVLGESHPQCYDPLASGMPLKNMFQDIKHIYIYLNFDSTHKYVKEEYVRNSLQEQFKTAFKQCDPILNISFIDTPNSNKIDGKNNLTYYVSVLSTFYVSEHTQENSIRFTSFPYRKNFNTFSNRVKYQPLNRQVFKDLTNLSQSEVEHTIDNLFQNIMY